MALTREEIMPQIGEVKKGKEIGDLDRNRKFIWHACIDCGKERWVRIAQGKPDTQRCPKCSQNTSAQKQKKREMRRGSKSHFWKGGRTKTIEGYILLKLHPDDFFYPMASKTGYVLEHRLVIAKALGRCLHRWEIVHHRHIKYPAGSVEDKQDNRYPENLQLVSDLGHNQITILENRIKQLEIKVEKQAKQINLLKWQHKTEFIKL